MKPSLAFPDGFRWGVATAAYQIEGATTVDGRGPSIWDTFVRTPGKVALGHTADTTCDHYHRYVEDVDLMASLGVGVYRFSAAWPRVRPDGTGPVNTAGLDFYDRLVDTLLGRGITPMLTLYHWDLPQSIEDRGGWTDRDTAHHFADFAEVMVRRLGDRVPTWTTLNEPWCSAFLGYGSGEHAPGRSDPAAAFRAAHHLLLGHGLALQRLRDAGVREASLTVNPTAVRARDPLDRADAAAARLVDGLHNRLWLDAVLRGRYPEDMLALFERFAATDAIRPDDLRVIGAPIDLLGVNYYTPSLVGAEVGQPASPVRPGSEGVVLLPQGRPVTAMNWAVDPTGLTEMLVRIATDYPGTPLMVTENGAPYVDVVTEGKVHDPERIAYLDGHLRAVHAALAAGADVRGYLVWTFTDNFEWSFGYTLRFGLVHVDYTTQRRIPKDSAAWFREVVRRGGLPSAEGT